MIPIELREYYRLWTRDDALRGIKPVPFPVNRPDAMTADLFVRVGLQYRCLGRVMVEGVRTYQWGEWLTCPVALQGYTDLRDPTPPQETP